MSGREKVIVTSAVVKWAREAAGYSLADAARKAKVEINLLGAIEDGIQRPSIAQLRRLGNLYKRPLALFLLEEIPHQKFGVMKDFRRPAPSGETAPESPGLRFAIRLAHERRETAITLATELAYSIPTFEATRSPAHDPEALGAVMRASLAIDVEDQGALRRSADGYNLWRDAIERNGVLVFQIEGVSVAEASGFSIPAEHYPVVAVNKTDGPTRRTFTLLHEYAHLFLHLGGVCDLEGLPTGQFAGVSIEAYCNRAAAAALVPAAALQAEEAVHQSQSSGNWTYESVRELAARFNVSAEAMVIRLRNLLLIPDAASHNLLKQSHLEAEEWLEVKRNKASPGFQPPSQRAYFDAGKPYTSLVLDAFHQGAITMSDASDYLAVRTPQIEKIQVLIRERGGRVPG